MPTSSRHPSRIPRRSRTSTTATSARCSPSSTDARPTPGSPPTLTAETFAQAFASRASYRRTGAPVEAWIFGIARNQLRRAVRKGRASTRARRRLGLQRLEVDDVSLERIEELVDLESVRGAVQKGLGSLSPGVAEALRLRVGLEMSYREVARELGCSERAARVRVARGLRKLQRILEVDG